MAKRGTKKSASKSATRQSQASGVRSSGGVPLAKAVKKKTTKNKNVTKKPLNKRQKIKKAIKAQGTKIKAKSLTLKEKIKKLKTEHKILFIAAIALIVVIFILFGTRMYLFVNFILGSDTIVQLTADTQDIFLTNGQKTDLEFQIYVSTNLFCEATCDYTFQDVSNGYVLDKANFSTTLSNPNKLSYNLVAPERGEGQILYHFEVACHSTKKGFCTTDEKERKRSYLVALNYELSEEQKEFKNRSTEELQKAIFEVDELNKIHLENAEMKSVLQEVIKIENLPKNSIATIEQELDLQLQQLKNYEYEGILREGLLRDINQTRIELISLNKNLTEKIEKYNNFTKEIGQARVSLVELIADKNITETNYESIRTLVGTYNDLVVKTQDTFDLEYVDHFLNFLTKNVENMKFEIIQSPEGNYTYPSLNIPNLKPLEKPFSSDYTSGRFIQIEEPMCCYKGDCEVCCTDNCKDDKDKFPILLVHGHSFNDAVSAESSIGDLGSIKDELTKDGIIDGGYVILKNLETKGTFARTNKQIVFAASYYFDIYQQEDESVVLQTKADSLDTYALRLNDIIENVKIMTNREKVYIVAHSMGGLVSRRYMQIFGTEDVEKLVMIGTPNHGVDGYVLSGCPVFGADIHCKAMNKDSLFLNKLNYGEKPDTEVSVIIGTGCPMNGVDSDGIVKNESAYLSWADNYYVEGKCNGVNFLHTEMLNVEKYPETYELVKQELGIK